MFLWANSEIVIGVVIINIFSRCINGVFGLLFKPFFKQLQSTPVEVMLILNICTAIYNFTAIISGFTMKSVSIRVIAVIGTICISLGLILTSFVSTWSAVVFSYSVIVGVGLGLLSPAVFLSLATTFKSGLNKAHGIGMAGIVVGDIVLQQLVGILLTHYEFDTTILVVGVVSLTGIFGAFLLKSEHQVPPLPEERPLISSDEEKQTNSRNEGFLNDFHMLEDKNFLILLVGMSCGMTIAVDFAVQFPFYLKDSAQLNEIQIAACMSLQAGSELVAELTFYLYIDYLKFSNKKCYLIGVVGSAFARLFLIYFEGFHSLAALSIILGYFKGIAMGNYLLILAEYFRSSPEKLPSAFSFSKITCGIFSLSFGPLLGWIHGGGYTLTFCVQSFFALLIFIVWIAD
ncbi:CLUMA_CG008072, isoform A [Clunio marinus]|uniref:CLUMA_CG008072, isoform A n=1 Tax=Clunio marinus TaxID=568069 RepID=A0A1J1I2Z4_9DIPT|nr:CLUMA_CG008072, isoform A [Clunio marinus]